MTEENNFPLLFSLFKESIIGKQVNQNSVWYNEIISNYKKKTPRGVFLR